MTVSVAIATHNGARFIRAQLESILAQTRPVNEIVISDDASTDSTLEVIQTTLDGWPKGTVCDDPTSVFPRVVTLRNDRSLGVTRNFEQAIRNSNGEFIALADQDDIWRADKIEKLAAMLEANPHTSLVYSDARLVSSSGAALGYSAFHALDFSHREKRFLTEGNFFRLLLRRNVITGATMMFRKELFARARPFPTEWLHDEWLAIIAASTGSVAYTPEQLVDYRQHDSNQIGMRRLNLLQKFMKLTEPGSSRNEKLFKRAIVLRDRLGSDPGLSEKNRRLILSKAEFETERYQYPSNRLARVPRVLAQIFSRNYSNFGVGAKDALRNMVQPL